MKKLLLNLSVLMLLSVASLYADTQVDQDPNVIVGKYVSSQNGRIKIDGNDGNIYLLEKKNIDSSIIIKDGENQAYVTCSDGIKELKVGSTVVINVKGVVLVEVKESK